MKSKTPSTNAFAHFLSRQKGLAKFLLLAAFIGTGVQVVRLSTQASEVQNLQQGVQTCFQRVYQTYTAQIIGATQSNYLTSNFTQTTEECFGETLNQLQALGVGLFDQAQEKLNTLSSDAYRFHERVTGGGDVETLESGVQVSQLGERFSQLENLKSGVQGSLSQGLSQLTSRKENLQWIFFLAGGVFAIVLVAEMIWAMRSRARTYQLEAQAGRVGEAYQRGSNEPVENLLTQALEENGLWNCADLFRRYKDQSMDPQLESQAGRGEKNRDLINQLYDVTRQRRELIERDQAGEQRPVELGQTATQRESHIEQIWSEFTERDHVIERDQDQQQQFHGTDSVSNFEARETSDSNSAGLHLDALLAQMVHRFSDKIFSLNIGLSFDVDEGIYIEGDEEQVQQALYHLISGAIERIQQKEAFIQQGETYTKEMRFCLKRNGPSIVLELEDSGLPLETEGEMGLSAGASWWENRINSKEVKEKALKSALLEYRISQEMMGELGHQLKFHYDSARATNHLKAFFQEVRPEASHAAGRLVNLQKGSKREILAKLQRQEGSPAESKIRPRPQHGADA